MLRWLRSDDSRAESKQAFSSVTAGLQNLYREKLLPVEKDSQFHQFYSPELTDADFACRPMILMMGQYSTGKSTFIRHLLERDYPGLRIGPEPTTDKFVCVTYGDSDQVIPGNALVHDSTLPFTQLSHFGNAFLTRLEAAKLDNPVLEGVTFIDTPGVLSGDKQRIKRGYDFEGIVKWFADRVDMVLLLFDAHKLDISDEFKRCITALKGNDQKIHIVLNKADRVTTQQLMRVYGALMWSLGKVVDTPEVTRVYVGSFWDEPLQNDEQRKLFEQEENDLYTHIAQLPRGSAWRKVNDVIKRARLAKTHALLLNHLRKQMPSMFGKQKEQRKLIDNLPGIYSEVAKLYNVPLGDFPHPQVMQEKLKEYDFTTFKKLDKKKMEALEAMLTKDMPALLKLIPEEQKNIEDCLPNKSMPFLSADPSPFAVMKVGGQTEATAYRNEWIRKPDTRKHEESFNAVGPENGKISGKQAKKLLCESKLPSNVLHRIWTLSDVDKDGFLDLYEYSLAQHFIEMKLAGHELPSETPPEMLPQAPKPEPLTASPFETGEGSVNPDKSAAAELSD